MLKTKQNYCMTQVKIIIVISMVMFLSYNSIGQTIRIPAEWEAQEKVWLTWFGAERRDSTTCRVIEALQPNVKISLNVPSDSMKTAAIKYMGNYKINSSEIEFLKDEYVDFFARDYVFFIKDEEDKLQIIDFEYSGYGLYPDFYGTPISEEEKKFGKWDERLGKQFHLPVVKSDYVFEGGGIDANGNGTLLIIEDMALQRNPGKSLIETENELTRTLGARKVIWLKKGLVEDIQFPKFGPFYKNYFGGGANMHVDELCRFVNDTTVVLPYISFEDKNKSPVDSINHDMLETNYKILQNAVTADGKNLKIIRIPMPEIENLKFIITVDESNYNTYKDFGFIKGDTIYRIPAASYCNFFISNNVVLIPKYWKQGMPETQKQKDNEVRKIFGSLFPGRQVIQIYTLGVNRGGGGIHCMTHELPIFRQ